MLLRTGSNATAAHPTHFQFTALQELLKKLLSKTAKGFFRIRPDRKTWKSKPWKPKHPTPISLWLKHKEKQPVSKSEFTTQAFVGLP